MKLVYLVENIDIKGGIERSLTTRVNYMVNHYDFDITIVCTQKKTGIPAYQLDNRVKLIFLKPLTSEKRLIKRVILRYNQAKFILNKLKPDILISVKFTLHNLFFLLLNSKTKLISELREPKQLYDINRNNSLKNKIKAYIRNFVFKRQNLLITLTKADKVNWGYNNMIFVPNPKTLHTTKTSSLNNKQVLAAGRLEPVKGFDILLDVWKLVVNNHTDWKLKICGTGKEYHNLRNKIETLDLQNSVILLNKNCDINEELINSSIFVLTSKFEAFGNVLVEAKTYGVPIVAFNVPNGPKEIIMNGEDGYIVPFNNIQVMAEKIGFLMKNELVRKKMGRKAVENSSVYNVENILELYKNAILKK